MEQWALEKGLCSLDSFYLSSRRSDSFSDRLASRGHSIKRRVCQGENKNKRTQTQSIIKGKSQDVKRREEKNL